MQSFVNFVYCYVAASFNPSCVPEYTPFAFSQRALHFAKLPAYAVFVNFVYCYISAFMLFKKLATWNGLEPSTSSVTGWHSNQLNYQAASCFLKKHGGRYRARTCDPLLVRQVLSQLS